MEKFNPGDVVINHYTNRQSATRCIFLSYNTYSEAIVNLVDSNDLIIRTYVNDITSISLYRQIIINDILNID